MQIFMKRCAEIAEQLYYLGSNDHEVDLFEGQFNVPDGISYNSYAFADDKFAVLDTAAAPFIEAWLENIETVLKQAGKAAPDYLVVHHMEPDHSAGIFALTEKYPATTIVGNAKTFQFMEQFFHAEFPHRLIVKEGDTLNLGHHTLAFAFAPMVHWPEVMVSFETATGALFSADGFGRFGALDTTENMIWDDEARRYYIGIVGKLGPSVLALLKKAAALDIKTVYPLHGPALSGDDLAHAVALYQKWAAYTPENDDVLVAYASIYGHTAAAACRLAEIIGQQGKKTRVIDLNRLDWAEATALAFQYGRIVLASPTYYGECFPAMREFLYNLVERNWQKRRVGFLENGTWAISAAKAMKNILAKAKNLEIVEPTVTIKSSLAASDEEALTALAKAIAQ